jgi:ATP synthase F1 complex assembly factor 2
MSLAQQTTKASISKLNKFWKKVSLQSTPQGHYILLDGKSLKTPQGSLLCIPDQKKILAYMIAGEWESQREILKSYSLPLVCFFFDS